MFEWAGMYEYKCIALSHEIRLCTQHDIPTMVAITVIVIVILSIESLAESSTLMVSNWCLGSFTCGVPWLHV